MATFLEINTIAQNPEYQSRVRICAAKAALAILGEGIGSMTEEQTRKRQATASSVLQGGQNWFNWSLALILSNATLQVNGLAATDGDLEFVMPSIWDDMSGVTTADTEVIEPYQ